MNEKKFKLFTGQSKYCSKWWIKYTIENGEWKSMSFPTKADRQRTINQLKEQGYTETKE